MTILSPIVDALIKALLSCDQHMLEILFPSCGLYWLSTTNPSQSHSLISSPADAKRKVVIAEVSRSSVTERLCSYILVSPSIIHCKQLLTRTRMNDSHMMTTETKVSGAYDEIQTEHVAQVDITGCIRKC